MESFEEKNIHNTIYSNENAYSSKRKQNQIIVMKKSSTVSTEHATVYMYNVIRVLGLYMPQQYKVPYILYSVIINLLVTIYLPLSFTISYLLVSPEDFDIGNLLTSVQIVCDIYSCSIKTLIMAFALSKLRASNSVLKKLDERCRDPDEIAELHRLVGLCRKIVWVIGLVYLSYPVSTCGVAVLSGVAPYSIFLPYIHWRRSHHEFVLQSSIEFSLLFGAITQHLGSDSCAVVYVCILRTHMKILLLRIRKLGSKETMSFDENYVELKMCIKDHKHLLELYNAVALVISKTTFVQFLVTGVILGITLVNFLIFTTESSKKFACCVLIIGVLVEIVPLCYFTQCLIADNELLSTEIFHSKWIDQDKRYRKMLIFFMQRTQQPMEFTAGKMIPITLNSVLSIAKFSFSLYTLIERMGIKERFNSE